MPDPLTCIDYLKHKKPVGESVAVIGAGGIGFDVCETLIHSGEKSSLNIPLFMKEWGIDMTLTARAGIEGVKPEFQMPKREVFLLQRKASGVGKGLGKTTGWVHRIDLKKKGVKMMPGCEYTKIDDDGLHIKVNDETSVLPVDNVIICAGQEPLRELTEGLNTPFHLIGGADVASELDAKRAIDQGTRVAASL